MQNENVEMRIVSGEILKNLFLKLNFKKKDKDDKDRIFNDTMGGKSDKPIHDDLKKAFKQLIPHYILICQQEDFEKHEIFLRNIIDDIGNLVFWPGDEFKKIGINDINPEEDKPNAMIQNYTVHAFTVEGDGENEGVVLHGTRILEGGRLDSISFSSPVVKWSESKYEHLHEFRIAVEECQEEVLAYYNGKCAPPRQKDLFEDEENEGSELSVNSSGKIENGKKSSSKKDAAAKKGSKKDKKGVAEAASEPELVSET